MKQIRKERKKRKFFILERLISREVEGMPSPCPQDNRGQIQYVIMEMQQHLCK